MDNNAVLENLVIGVCHWILMSWSLVIGRTKLCPEGVFHCRMGGSGAATLAPCPLPQPGAHSEQDRSGWCGAVSPELWEATQKSRSKFKPAPEHVSPVNTLLSPPRAPKERTEDPHRPVCRWCRVLGQGVYLREVGGGSGHAIY